MIEFLLFSLGGIKYGIREKDILAIKDVHYIHWLPSNPSHIAGMSTIDGRIAALLDLSAYIGHSKISRDQKNYTVLMPRQEKDSVFIIEDEQKSLSIPSDLIFPLPVSLQTSLIDSCVLHDSEPVPVINITKIYDYVRKPEDIPRAAGFLVPCVKQKKISPFEDIRLFEIGGQQFAVRGKKIKKLSNRPEKLSKPAYMPHYVEGLFFYDREVMPLINLPLHLKPTGSGLENQILIAMAGGQSFGFLVDSDRGTLEQNNFKIKPLPPLTQSNWMQEAVINENEIIPIIDIDVLMSERPDCPDRRPMPERYSPASDFQLRILRNEVKVVEFSLAGIHHFLPGSEVVDCLKFKPFRRLPDLMPIILGVTEHAGELLPVLDLSICFGRSSYLSRECSMILVENGDFRALVLAEAMMDERRLSVDMQRELPFIEPFNLIYGCFPDNRAVKLILNVEALAVHYNSNFSREFFKKFSEDTTKENSLALEKPEEDAEISCSIESQDHEKYQWRNTSMKIDENAIHSINMEEPIFDIESNKNQIQQIETEPKNKNEDISEEIEPEPNETNNMYKPKDIDFQDRLDSPDSTVPENHQAPDTSLSNDQQAASETKKGKEPVAGDHTENILITKEKRPVIEKSTEKTAPEQNETEEINKKRKNIIAVENTEEEEKEDRHLIDSEQTSEIDTNLVIQEEPELKKIKADSVDEIADKADNSESIERDLPATGAIKDYNKTVGLKISHKRLIFCLFVIFIIGAFSFKFIFKDKIISRFLEQKPAVPAIMVMQIPNPEIYKEQDRPNMQNDSLSDPVKIKKENDNIKIEKPDEPEIGTNSFPVPTESQELRELNALPIILPHPEIYEVKNGDNLWRISERFTGNGFNYPNIARENNIDNPDLIFPNQHIVITKKVIHGGQKSPRIEPSGKRQIISNPGKESVMSRDMQRKAGRP